MLYVVNQIGAPKNEGRDAQEQCTGCRAGARVFCALGELSHCALCIPRQLIIRCRPRPT